MQAPPDHLLAPGTGHYIEQFGQLNHCLPGNRDQWSRDQRKTSLAHFGKIGFPTQKDEDWRYTPLRPITGKSFDLVTADPVAADDGKFGIPDLDSYRIIFRDGVLDPDPSDLDQLGDHIEVQPVSSFLDDGPEARKSGFGEIIGAEEHGFTALNSALFNGGVVMTLQAGAVVDKPIELIFISGRKLAMAQPRNRIVAERGSKMQVVERYVSAGPHPTLTNSATEIVLDEGAEADYYIIQTQAKAAYQVCGVWVRQAAASRFSCRTVTLGGALVRNNLCAELGGADAHCDMYGAYSLSGRQHVDNHTTMIHAARNCTSNELYKGVLDQRSRGVFRGRIKVEPDAQKTDAQQANNTLILSRDAEIDTKPQLEIYADDVKCSHGATIGQMDEQALFYLRSRGIDRQEAESLLTYAFVSDVLGQIEIDSLRRYLEKVLGEQLIHEDEHPGRE
ncbi:MAG: Fe-S cluster assembly protein SufD [Gammaproteobacteria bacterium]|nr:Fe-S cluster assembly protein SufD [Gammaproteobacteria bacterium]